MTLDPRALDVTLDGSMTFVNLPLVIVRDCDRPGPTRWFIEDTAGTRICELSAADVPEYVMDAILAAEAGAKDGALVDEDWPRRGRA